MVATVHASTQSAGMCKGTPDVCNTPAYPSGSVPVCYINVTACAQATMTALKVKMVMAPVLHNLSMISISSGDEAGTLGGLRSGLMKGPMTYATGSSKVFIEGKPCAHHTAMTRHDGMPAYNADGMQDVPSQSKVLIAR